MLHSGLSRSQTLPLLAAASSPSRTLLAGLLRAGYLSKSAASSPALRLTTATTTTRASTRAVASPGDPSRFGLGPRVSLSTAPDGSASAGGGRALPWLAAACGDGGAPAARASAGRSSSWESSAEKFLSRGDQSARRDVLEDRVSNKEEAIREEENEPIDNPKWGRIKYRRIVVKDGSSRGERFRGERFDKPEVRQWNKQENWGRKTWKEAGESTVPKMVGQGVYGVGPVLAALMAGRREFYALYMQEGMDLSGSNKKKKDKKGVEKVLRMAESIGLKVIEASKHDLNMVVDNRPHQGLVLDASPLEMVNTKELEPVRMDGGKAPVWIALDEVMDPQNLGAIIRSAYFFGAEGVVLCAKNSAPLSGVVSKASAGSLELTELLSCRNMMQFLSSSAENGWRVLGGTVAPKAIPLTEVATGEPTILVLGSEGTGLRPLVERSCTHLVKIPGNVDGFVLGADTDADADAGEEGDNYSGKQDMKSLLAVESLNVSVAAGVLLYHLAGKNVCPGWSNDRDLSFVPNFKARKHEGVSYLRMAQPAGNGCVVVFQWQSRALKVLQVYTLQFHFQLSFAFASDSPFCGSGDCLDELLLARFLLKDRIGGQPTTGTAAPLHQIRAPVDDGGVVCGASKACAQDRNSGTLIQASGGDAMCVFLAYAHTSVWRCSLPREVVAYGTVPPSSTPDYCGPPWMRIAISSRLPLLLLVATWIGAPAS